MQVHPIYKANEEILKYKSEEDTLFSFEEVDKIFDRAWCDTVMETIAKKKHVRKYYVLGYEIGNTKKPNVKYYLQLC